MPRLVLMRHAKAVPAGSVDDFERPLAQRGFDDSVVAAAWLNNQRWRIDEALVSSALRTRQTFESVGTHLNYPLAARFIQEIYDASAGEILAQIRQTSLETLLVIGHSPGIPRLATVLARGGLPRDLLSGHGYPTSAISVLESPAPFAQWEPEAASFVDFTVPRADDPGARND